ncbi:HAD family hydrolase [Capnocytophaga sp.]|uniref:KdsC family phosphatase n=1 Tax=Capnocytophaga sp. TaxID=44737 RepID=UPI0026DB1EFE|nr:HAD hydrolase family protein [Capnocytophaga sp.]MDO5104960.1 HAD hydrolase family protein [Capnocytophaga sp.]
MEAKSYKEFLRNITTFVFDIDGVLTNAQVLVTNEGELLRSMSVKDGFAMKLALDKGYNMCIITGGNNQGAKKRLEDLGIVDIFMKKQHKLDSFLEYQQKKGLKKEEILYMGDDLPDISPMQYSGLATCPQDAAPEVKAVADYISHLNGGEGCVRDVITQVLKARGDWDF